MLRTKKLEIREKRKRKLKEPSDENQTEYHEIEPCLREIILRFEMNL
jgi:hypothetical protein